MAKHSVDVLIKARDEASKKFSVVATSATVMGRALKGAASITKSTLSVAFRTAKRAAIGLAAAFAYCTYAAIKQEAAEISLKGVLIGLGKYTKETMEDFKKFASEMQEVTTYGDEYVLSLLGVAMAQTKSSGSAKKIVSDMIALKEIIPAGRMRLESFMKMVLGFHQGSKELDTYLIRLKGVTDETKRQTIYNEYLKASWGLWEEKIEGTQDALTKIKNKLGDIAEAIGTPFLPSVKAAAQAVKNWAKENESDITVWAKKFHSSVVFVKDVMWDFAKFMREDWIAAFQIAIKAAINQFVMLGKITGVIAKKIAVDMANVFAEPFINLQKRLLEIGPKKPLMTISGQSTTGLKRRTEPWFDLRQAAITWQEVGEDIKKTIKEAFRKTLKDIPAELRAETKEAWSKHLQRLKGITVPGGGGVPGEARAAGDSAMGGAVQALAAGIRQLQPQEARFLTLGTGTRFDYVKETAKNTNNNGKTLRMIERCLRNMIRNQENEAQVLRD